MFGGLRKIFKKVYGHSIILPHSIIFRIKIGYKFFKSPNNEYAIWEYLKFAKYLMIY